MRRALALLLGTPRGNLLVVARQQHLGHPHSAKHLRLGVVRRIKKALLKRIGEQRLPVADHAGNQADDGINQYERVRFSDGFDGFKSALYIYRANHGQFNTTWGDNDLGMLVAAGFLNRGALLPPEQQRQIASVYLSAFFEAALKGQTGYLPLFADARAAPAGWLPDTLYIHRFNRAGDRLLADFEEDVDLLTASLPGGRLTGENLKLWREQRIHAKGDAQFNAGVYLGWTEEAPAAYTLTLPPGTPAPAEAIIFALADALQDPTPQGQTPAPPAGPRQPIDLTVTLVDAAGNEAALPLSAYRPIQPQLPAPVFKAALFERRGPSEPVLQSYSLPLAHFTAANPAFDPARIAAIRFVFDRTPRGSVVLDEVGFR